MFKYNSDQLRYNVITKAVENPVDSHEFKESDLYKGRYLMNCVYEKSGELSFYEIWSEQALDKLRSKEGYSELSTTMAINKFIKERLSNVFDKAGFTIIDYDFDGEILEANGMHETSDNSVTEGLIFEEDPTMNATSITPKQHQNPNRVNLMLKTLFDQKFTNKYEINTDAGLWKPIKTFNKNGSLFIVWECEEYKLKITTWVFPNNTNKIDVEVTNSDGSVKMDHYFDIYRIPRTVDEGEYFLTKSFFNLLKKFIDTQVIKMSPVNKEYSFWKADNPHYPYSFSTPKKNKIINDLIRFINISSDPRLDTFFTQNNLKHKQGYLQTLLDSAEEAGIFKFNRKGNEIVVQRGENYKSYIDGKIRRI